MVHDSATPSPTPEAAPGPSADDRSRDRYRRISLTTAAAVLAQGSAAATALIAARLTIGYLGDERYGLWMVIASTISLFVFADLGVGQGLLNAISHAHGRDDREEVRRAVASAIALMSVVATVIVVLFAAVYAFVPWPAVFNLTDPTAADESGPAMAVIVACVAANALVGLGGRIQMGFQEGYRLHLWQAAGSIAALAAVVVASRMEAGVPWLVLAGSGVPATAMFVNLVVQLAWTRRWLRPRLAAVSRAVAGQLLRRGLMFAGFAVLGPLAFYSDNLVTAHVVSAEAVAAYAVNAKLFSLVTVFFAFVAGALWPAYGEAYARNDHAWIVATLRRVLLGGGAVALAGAAMLIWLTPWLIEVWLGKPMASPLALRLGFALWLVLSAIGFNLGTFLSAINMLKFNLTLSAGMTAAALGLKIWLGVEWGAPGVIWGVAIAYGVSLIPCAWFIPRLLARMRAGRPVTRDVFWIS
ncbi:MAG: lipopolysaccharide biosynthesis protein [Planctomycetota bacterium]